MESIKEAVKNSVDIKLRGLQRRLFMRTVKLAVIVVVLTAVGFALIGYGDSTDDRIADLEAQVEQLTLTTNSALKMIEALNAQIAALEATQSLRIGYLNAEDAFTAFTDAVKDLRQKALDKQAEIVKLQQDFLAGKISKEDYQAKYNQLQVELLQAQLNIDIEMLDKMISDPGFSDIRSDLERLKDEAQPLVDEVNNLVLVAMIGVFNPQEFQSRYTKAKNVFTQLDQHLTQAATSKIVEAANKVAVKNGYDLVLQAKNVIIYRNTAKFTDITNQVKDELSLYLGESNQPSTEKGGVQVALQAQGISEMDPAQRDNTINQLIALITTRLSQYGITDAQFKRISADQVLVSLPVTKVPLQVYPLLAERGLLQVMKVVQTGTTPNEILVPASSDQKVIKDFSRIPYLVDSSPLLTENALSDARLCPASEVESADESSIALRTIVLTLSPKGAQRFVNALQHLNVGDQLAIVLDDYVIFYVLTITQSLKDAAARGWQAVQNSLVIQALLTNDEAVRIAIILRNGALPVPVKFSRLPNSGKPNVKITRIFYDGNVPRVESDEYVEIKNLGDEAQDLFGWKLKDISDGYPELIFPHYVLLPHQSIRVYTNEIHPEWGGFSFHFGQAVWNNTRPDVAVLYNAQGEEVSRKSY